MCKKMWQSFLSVTVAIAIIVTSFLSPVHADQAADVNSILTKVNQIYSRLGTMNTKMSYGGQDFTWFLNEIWGDTLDMKTQLTQFEADITVIQGNTQQYIDGDPTDSSTLLLATSYWEQIVQLLAESYNKMNAMNATSAEESQKLTQIVNALAQMHQDSISIAGKIDSIVTYLDNRFNTFDIPIESLVAFNYFYRYDRDGDITTSNASHYPQIKLISSSSSGEYITNRRVYVPGGHTLVIAFLGFSNNVIDSTTMPAYVLNDSGGYTVDYRYIPINNTRRMFHVCVTNNNTATISVSFDFLQSMTIIPFFVGYEDLMSEEMRSSILYWEKDSNYTIIDDIRSAIYDSSDGQSWLQKIYNHLVGDPDSNNKTQQDIDSMNNKVDTIQDNLDNYSDQLDQNIQQVSPSGILMNVQQQGQKVTFLSGIIQQVFTSFGSYSWLFLLPLVFGLILLFMG